MTQNELNQKLSLTRRTKDRQELLKAYWRDQKAETGDDKRESKS